MSTRWAPSSRRRLKYFAVYTFPPIVGQGALCRFLFSAEGAGFNPSLGQRPRTGESLNASAEGAIQRRGQVRNPMNRAFSARAWLGNQFLGRCPRLNVRQHPWR
jgi:hypothetical protein